MNQSVNQEKHNLNKNHISNEIFGHIFDDHI